LALHRIISATRLQLPVLLGVAVAASAIAGCSDSDDATKTVTVEREVTVEEPPAPPSERRKPRTSRPRATQAPAEPEFVDCDPNIEAKAGTTTCPFAQNTFWTYWTSGKSSTELQVWSPAVQSSFPTECEDDGAQVVCTTPDGGAVRFPQAALDSYSQAQADAYAGAHDLGPDPYEGLPTPENPSSGGDGGGGQDCQGYDPCIPPGDDVDCASGEGNGPRYVDGPVYVDGADPYGLDANYDGVGCEW
jgi:hypothetical protein